MARVSLPSQSQSVATPRPRVDFGMLLVVVLWGANFPIVKAAFSHIPPFLFSGLRFLIASSTLLLLLRWREGLKPLPPGTLWHVIWLGVVGNTLYQSLFVTGLSMTTAANSAMLLSTTPALVALFGGLLGLERITRHMVGGILLAMAGIALVMTARGAAFSLRTLTGDLITLISVLCWVSYVLGIRTLAGKISSLRLTTLTMLTGTPGLLLLGAPQFASVNWRSLGGAAWFGILFSAWLALVVGYLLYNRSIHRIGSVQTSIHGCAIPLIATLVAWPLLGEQPTLWQGLGAILIIAGVLLTRRGG